MFLLWFCKVARVGVYTEVGDTADFTTISRVCSFFMFYLLCGLWRRYSFSDGRIVGLYCEKRGVSGRRVDGWGFFFPHGFFFCARIIDRVLGAGASENTIGVFLCHAMHDSYCGLPPMPPLGLGSKD